MNAERTSFIHPLDDLRYTEEEVLENPEPKQGIDRNLEDQANAFLREFDDIKLTDEWSRKVSGLEPDTLEHLAHLVPDRRHSKSYANPSAEIERDRVMR